MIYLAFFGDLTTFLFAGLFDLYMFWAPPAALRFYHHFLGGRDLCILWNFRALLGSSSDYHLFPRRSGPVWFLVVFAFSDRLEILPTFYSLFCSTLTSSSCGPVRSRFYLLFTCRSIFTHILVFWHLWLPQSFKRRFFIVRVSLCDFW